MPTLSIVIPTLNEAATLPALLDALNAQTRPPNEIIVADAGSKDNTRQLAGERGAVVVSGGRPGPGRNAGARAAAGEVLLFLDADVMPRPNFVELALDEFERNDYAVATTLIAPLENDTTNLVLAEASNLYLQVVQYFSPHAPGFCIFARREVHNAIGGFDEKVKLAEDHDYVQRAARHGEFGVITGVHVPVSMRRLEKEGLTKLAFKYVWCEMHALAGRPIYSTPFEYEFGAHLPAAVKAASARRLIDIAQLREQLGQFENPIDRLSRAGIGRLDELVRAEWLGNVRERIRPRLETPDLETLHQYLLRRLALIRKSGRPLRDALVKFQTTPVKEQIRLLDMNWLRSRLPGTGPLGNFDPRRRTKDHEDS